jgi:PPK2 family polyphosphate:nucleotide phosphotransferase
MAKSKQPITRSLQLPAGAVDWGRLDPRATPGFADGKTAGKRALERLGPSLSELQERLYAEGRTGGSRSILLVLQGMDTSGKGGVVRHCAGLLDPQGVALASFKAPTAAERAKGFLWRIRQELPAPGMVGIFDRSHYEDVLIARVRKLTRAATIEKRYDAINAFESALTAAGTTIVKCYLHISAEEQLQRLLSRLDDPSKHWKYNPSDVEERARWDDYRKAYDLALTRCNTKAAPWYVIPSDRKWYRNWAVTKLLLEHLEALDPKWPAGDFDVAEERRRLLSQPSQESGKA